MQNLSFRICLLSLTETFHVWNNSVYSFSTVFQTFLAVQGMFFSFMYGQNCYCYVKPAYKKDDFVRAGTQTSYVGDEAVKSRERAAIHSACRSLVCLCTYTKPPATQAMLRHIMCTVPATNRDARCWGIRWSKGRVKRTIKTGNWCFATLLRNELKRDVARFIAYNSNLSCYKSGCCKLREYSDFCFAACKNLICSLKAGLIRG